MLSGLLFLLQPLCYLLIQQSGGSYLDWAQLESVDVMVWLPIKKVLVYHLDPVIKLLTYNFFCMDWYIKTNFTYCKVLGGVKYK